MEGKRKHTFSAHSFIPRATFTGSWTGALLLFHSNQWAVYFRVDPAHQHLGTKCWVLGRGEDLIFPGTQIEAKTSRYIVRSCKRVGRIQCADFIIQIRGTSQTALGYSIHFLPEFYVFVQNCIMYCYCRNVRHSQSFLIVRQSKKMKSPTFIWASISLMSFTLIPG